MEVGVEVRVQVWGGRRGQEGCIVSPCAAEKEGSEVSTGRRWRQCSVIDGASDG